MGAVPYRGRILENDALRSDCGFAQESMGITIQAAVAVLSGQVVRGSCTQL